jgi:pyruvate dehydrogenase E1 component alpha subunit
LYNEYTHYSETTAGQLIARAQTFGMCAEIVDGQDVHAVYTTMQRLVERARCGEGPAFLQCDTYRYYGHHVGDINRAYYRAKEEETEWRANRDPLKILSARLVAQKLTDASVIERIEAEVNAEVESGVAFALNAPFPDAREVDEDVYA